jgi:Fe-S cluster assembly protein SufD
VTALANGVGTAELAPYRARFERQMAERRGPSWLRSRREEAMARAEARGFPGLHDEEWRFTPVAPITRTPFDGGPPPASAPRELHALRLGAGAAAAELVFVNGRYAPELSSPSASGPLRVASLGATLEREPGLVEPHLFRVAGEDSVFADLNSGLAEDGAVVVVPPGTALERPVHLLHLSTGSNGRDATMAHTRVLVVMGRGSQAALAQTWAGPEGAAYLATTVAEVLLEDGAVLDHYRLQQEGTAGLHVSTLHALQGRDSRFTDHALLLGGALSRNDVSVRLEGEGAECALDGLFLAGGTQHVDAHTRLVHARPHCTSRELYNGVLDGRARGVFHGRIEVMPDAQKTSAHQANHNLLLSREALVNSTPALVIHADDVKCKHGSTTGQLDAQALFYLRARGIGEAEARALLVAAFAGEVLGRVALPPVRQRLGALLARRLPGAPQELFS